MTELDDKIVVLRERMDDERETLRKLVEQRNQEEAEQRASEQLANMSDTDRQALLKMAGAPSTTKIGQP